MTEWTHPALLSARWHKIEPPITASAIEALLGDVEPVASISVGRLGAATWNQGPAAKPDFDLVKANLASGKEVVFRIALSFTQLESILQGQAQFAGELRDCRAACGTWACDPVYSLEVGTGASLPGDTPAVRFRCVTLGYSPDCPELYPVRRAAGATLRRYSSDDLARFEVQVLDRLFDTLVWRYLEAKGLGFAEIRFDESSKRAEISRLPAAHFFSNLVPSNVSPNPLEWARRLSHEVYELSSRLLQGGTTTAAVFEGRTLLFHKELFDPDSVPEKYRSMSMWVPLGDLSVSPLSESTALQEWVGDAGLVAYTVEATFIESCYAINKLSPLTARVDKLLSTGGKVMPTTREYRSISREFHKVKIGFDDARLSARRHLNRYSFDSLSGFPNARESYLDESFPVSTCATRLDLTEDALTQGFSVTSSELLEGVEIIVAILVAVEVVLGALELLGHG